MMLQDFLEAGVVSRVNNLWFVKNILRSSAVINMLVLETAEMSRKTSKGQIKLVFIIFKRTKYLVCTHWGQPRGKLHRSSPQSEWLGPPLWCFSWTAWKQHWVVCSGYYNSCWHLWDLVKQQKGRFIIWYCLDIFSLGYQQHWGNCFGTCVPRVSRRCTGRGRGCPCARRPTAAPAPPRWPAGSAAAAPSGPAGSPWPAAGPTLR